MSSFDLSDPTELLNLINYNKWNDIYNILEAKNKLFDCVINGKNLFHYACMRGNIEIINKYLDIKTNKIYISDEKGNTGFHLLALNDWDNILLEKIELFPEFLKLKNNNDGFIYNLCLKKYDIFKKIIYVMDELKYYKYLNYVNENTNRTIILDVIDQCTEKTNTSKKYFEILKFFDKIKLDFTIPNTDPPLLYVLINGYANLGKYMLENLVNCRNIMINTFSDKQLTPLIVCLKNKFNDVTTLILDLDVDINYSGMENKYVPLSLAFKHGFLNISKKMINFKNIDLDKRDTQLNTPIYYLIKYLASNRSNLNKNDIIEWKNILEYMIEKCDLQNLNIGNETPFHLLVKYEMWEEFKNKLLEKKININLANKNGFTPLTYIKPKNLPKLMHFIENLIEKNSILETKINDIILPQVNTDDGYFGLFNSDGIHNIIYLINFLNKYDNLQIPIQLPINDKIMWDRYIILMHGSRDDSNTETINSLVNSYMDTFYVMLPCMIFWKDKYLNYFNKNKLYLKRAITNTKRFVMLRVTIIVTSSLLHANIVMYDKQLNKLIRFEPYGDWEFHDSYNLDKHVIELFKIAIDKNLHSSLKYVRPSEYLDKTKFQSTSLGDHRSEKNLGDPQGYCLAWCFWFTELKLLNPDIDENNLVSNALDKIIKNDNTNINPLLTYIRAYSKQLDKNKNKYLENIGIDKNEIYKTSYTYEKLDIIRLASEKNVIKKLLNL